MSIQSNFNQSLSLVGLLAGMNPAIKAHAERNIKLKSLTTKKKRIEESVAKGAAKVPAKDTEDGLSEITRLSKEIFETSPTEENLSSYLSSLPKVVTTIGPATAEEIADGDLDDVIQEELEEEDRKRAYEERKAFFRAPREEAERHSVEALETRRAEEAKSRDFAKMITEGVYSDFTDVRPGKGVR